MKPEKWTDLQAHLDSYMSDVMCSCFQDAKDDDENAKVTIQNYISMYNCPNEFAVWLDEMMIECFTEHDPFEGVGAIGECMIRRDILDAQGGDGLRKLYDSFKQEMEQSDFLWKKPLCAVCVDDYEMDASPIRIPPFATVWVFHSSGAAAAMDDDACFPLCAKCAKDAKDEWDWSDAKDGETKEVPITFKNRGLKDAVDGVLRLLDARGLPRHLLSDLMRLLDASGLPSHLLSDLMRLLDAKVLPRSFFSQTDDGFAGTE